MDDLTTFDIEFTVDPELNSLELLRIRSSNNVSVEFKRFFKVNEEMREAFYEMIHSHDFP
ncbi:hypothetical protein [Paenibacillus ihumii]|uniref:hypothetical protein n=1 Tax=Paenibacillus ihumii TaxID=687436 RepID=UPI0006D81D62|nr:hypothetical protein [Paenibacillus ihumii]